jgi:hypothetical protein
MGKGGGQKENSRAPEKVRGGRETENTHKEIIKRE